MRAYLGLGSNLGDRLVNLRAARDALAAHGVCVLAGSSVYETEPQGEMIDQPDFLNAAVAIETELDPEALLDLCKSVEDDLGRVAAGPRHGPRPIDVDLLLMGSVVHSSQRLTLPHPEVTARRFVLEPLLELEASLELPDGTRLAEVRDRLRGQRVARTGAL